MIARRRSGFALLAALGLSVAIVAVTLAFALDAHRDRLAVTNQVEYAEALAAARAGVAVAQSRLDRLMTGAYPPPPVPIDNNDPWEFADTLVGERAFLNGPGSAGYVVHVRDAGAVLDINQAGDVAWTNFFSALNVDGDVAAHLAATIGDWRDVDDITRVNGAERAEYISAGRVVLPANTDFGSIDDLKNVLGMTPSIFRAAAPYLALSSTGTVSVNTAPIPVLRTIPQFSDPVIAAILARRQSYRRFTSPADLATVAPGITSLLTGATPFLANQLTFSTQTVLITSTGWSPGGHTHVTEVVQVTRGTPVASVVWRRDE